MKIAIIGNSAAGTAAVEAIRKHDQESIVTQITDEIYPIYSRCLLSYYISNKIEKKGLQYRSDNFHKIMHTELNSGKRVSFVDPEKQILKCTDGTSFDYDKLLIATGGIAKMPDYFPKETKGIFLLRNIKDAEAIKKYIKTTKNVIILGGGLIGMRAAQALVDYEVNIKIIIGSKHILSQMIDDKAASIISRRLYEYGIEELTETDISEIVSEEGKIRAVKTKEGQIIKCDMLIVAKGVKANTEIVQSTNIDVRSGIVTNSCMQTNYENIYAAGDVAETYDIATNEHSINALWTCAVQQGNVAGLNMINKKTIYDGSLGMNSLNIFDIPTISFGLNNPKDGKKYNVLTDDRVEKNIYKKIVIHEKRIKGIILVGNIENAGVLLSLIQKKKDVSKYEDELISDRFNFGSIIKNDGINALREYE